ncbi:MAG: hypothetical protein MJK14_09045 [Rivularia sp. ALOHA_DT_140]|nr:hypothetical protein [Rivularia sp. ALOHA_DT_140]
MTKEGYYGDFVKNTIDIFEEEDYQEIFKLLDTNEVNQYGDKKYLFPFYRKNCDFLAIFLTNKKQKYSPIININDVLELSFIYRNLTTMMQTLAEYFETGAYYLDEDEEGYLNGDEEKMLPIFQKYNPDLILIS